MPMTVAEPHGAGNRKDPRGTARAPVALECKVDKLHDTYLSQSEHSNTYIITVWRQK